VSKNDITGDNLVSKKNTDSYRDNFDRIFGKKAETFVVDGSYVDVVRDGDTLVVVDFGSIIEGEKK